MREPGYYWVKIYNDWEIAEWSVCWERIGYEMVFDDSAFEEIDENRIEREPSLTIAGIKVITNDMLPPDAIIFKDTGNGYVRIK